MPCPILKEKMKKYFDFLSNYREHVFPYNHLDPSQKDLIELAARGGPGQYCAYIMSCKYSENLFNEFKSLADKLNNENKDMNKELNILSSEVEKLKKENEKLRSSNNELESLYYNLMDEIYELKEHASSLSDRLQEIETPVKQPPLILV